MALISLANIFRSLDGLSWETGTARSLGFLKKATVKLAERMSEKNNLDLGENPKRNVM